MSKKHEVQRYAKEVLGANNEDVHYVSGKESDVKYAEEEFARKNKQASDEFAEKFEKHKEELTKASESIADKVNLQIMPVGSHVIVSPFATNPFQRIKVTKSGIVTSTGGLTPEYKSSDTGEWEEMQKEIYQGAVMFVGPLCKWVKPGDIVMWLKSSECTLPLYSLGYKVVDEKSLLCIINEKLDERFKDQETNN